MTKNSKHKNSKYFAAANSYRGFISYFDRVFPSEIFDRIYVLKGGPGTGKSSFMKKASAMMKEKDCCVDEIYCSSDPHSLDGVIAEKNGKCIAIIDGTAPHERDAVIPGAIDEIINLGGGWDSRWLTAKRDRILKIGKEKSNAYKNGYRYLKIAGEADAFILDVYKNVFNKNKAKSKAEEILSSISPSNKNENSIRLISSFGRYGYYRLSEDECNLGQITGVHGDNYSATLFINLLQQTALSKEMSFIDIKSPLNPALSEGLSFDGADITILKSNVGDINSFDFLTDDKMYQERTRRAKEIKKSALEEAERWFSIASELHFQLEEIYGSAMDFDKNNKLLDDKLTEIENILQI